MVSLKNAGIKRDGRWLVRGVDLEICAGEIVTLIGPNGSGKSTTTKMSLGVLPPDEGVVTRKTDLTIGYVPQKITVDWALPLTVSRFMQLTKQISQVEVEHAYEATGISHLTNEMINTLSGGEFQRVLLARAIARKPQLLVLDEPIQGVDFAGEAALYQLIKSIRDDLRCGILLVSHDLHVVMAETDRVICLNGHVCCSGTPKAVASSSAYRNLFGDRANPSIALYEHNHDHTHLADGRVLHGDGTISDHCDHVDEGGADVR